MLNEEDKLYRISSVAKRLLINRKKLYKLITHGKIKAFNVGSVKRPEYRISESEIEKYLASVKIIIPLDPSRPL